MQVTAKSRRAARLQNYLFVLLLLVAVGLLAWLSTRFNYQSDWTAGGRRSLSDASVQVLAKVSGPIKFTAFAGGGRGVGERGRAAGRGAAGAGRPGGAAPPPPPPPPPPPRRPPPPPPPRAPPPPPPPKR